MSCLIPETILCGKIYRGGGQTRPNEIGGEGLFPPVFFKTLHFKEILDVFCKTASTRAPMAHS